MQVFGPVPSRRLGNSLGVSLIPPKDCSYSCIYCQLGITDKYSITPSSFYDRRNILVAIEQKIINNDVDYITFAGDGEPTLSSDLEWILKQCREKFNLPTAVITNGSLIYKNEISNALQHASLVLPSIDAGSETVFRKINRPHKDLDYVKIIEGIINFANDYNGKIWTETMVVKGYNDTLIEIEQIAEIIKKISSEKSFIITPTRPPQLKIEKPEPEILSYANQIIPNSVVLDMPETGDFGIDKFSSLEEALTNISSRHPLRIDQAQEIAKKFNGSIENLLSKNIFTINEYCGTDYLLPINLFKKQGKEC